MSVLTLQTKEFLVFGGAVLILPEVLKAISQCCKYSYDYSYDYVIYIAMTKEQ